MKRKRAMLSPARQLSKFGSKLVILVCLVLFLLAFLRLHFYPTLRSLISIYHSSRVLDDDPFKSTPKIAFLFLARANLPLDFVWGTFFKNVDMGMFSIYVHSEPRFVLDESNTRSAFFYGRQLNNSIQVAWGATSMIGAERLLIEAALDDPANQRFVLLSDSCIPLYNFSYVYSYLMSSPNSFVDRKHAAIVVEDDIVFPVFGKFYKRWPPADLRKRRQMLQASELVQHIQTGHNCIPDEHYIQTLLKIGVVENELERRTLTYSLWNQSSDGGEMSSWHPFQLDYTDASPRIIQGIKDINHVYYEHEDQKELCHVNITTAPCFLFARKFTPWAAVRQLTE